MTVDALLTRDHDKATKYTLLINLLKVRNNIISIHGFNSCQYYTSCRKLIVTFVSPLSKQISPITAFAHDAR